MLVYTPRKGLIVIGIILLFIRGSFSQLNYQNCTSAPCDLKCSGKTICSQSCNKRPCGMFCNSSQACQQTCVNGGCQKMKCESKTVSLRADNSINLSGILSSASMLILCHYISFHKKVLCFTRKYIVLQALHQALYSAAIAKWLDQSTLDQRVPGL